MWQITLIICWQEWTNYCCRIAYVIIKNEQFYTADYYKHEIYSFEFLYSWGPTHARKIETEVILAAFNNIFITGFK